MNLFNDVIHMLSSAGVEAASGRIEAVEKEGGQIGCFGCKLKFVSKKRSQEDILISITDRLKCPQ